MFPQKPWSFRYFEKLWSHGYDVFSKIAKLSYYADEEHALELIKIDAFENVQLAVYTYGGLKTFFADTEVVLESGRLAYAPKKLKEK